MPEEEKVPAAATSPQDMRFSDALGELELVVKELESGEAGLEESIERYERGVGLLTACRAKLDEAEQKITLLMGELEAEDEPEAGAG
jgi:exodeoxyribonuclease VII small subunit